MREHYSTLPHLELPDDILYHSWVVCHHTYTVSESHRLRLELEKKHVNDIAQWCEITFVRSEIRRQIRRIDGELRTLYEPSELQ